MSAFERIKAELLADKRKAGVLAALGLLVVVLGLRAAFSGDRRAAGRQDVALVSTSAGDASPLTAVADDPETRFRALAAALPAPPLHPSLPVRDLFALNTEYFPHAAEPDPAGTVGAKPALGTDDESLRRSAAVRDAESIRLKSTLIGERPVAVLDLSGIGGGSDAIVRVGDAVNGFKVVRIEAKRVILERDGERIERRVRSPID